MDYTGEHLLPGILGHFFIILSLVASLVATFAYFKTTRSKNEADVSSWKTMARGAFLVEVLSVFAIFGILFYIIYNHLFEYKYAWQHSSRTLEVKYLLSCFWEGQEGSFLLWSIWHCVLGSILIRKARNWEAPVMTVVSFAQVCLATMIAGIYFFNWRMGSNPFVLLRNEMDAPIFSQPNYLSLIKDGNDLNPLLQNYWMVIHPPVLFLGFASTIVPFAFAIAGLWTKKTGDWTKPALPWALFSAAVLGTGIMMGGRWAYESLNFGGYWAWDPVENASMVPWLTLIGGIHTLLIYKHTGHSLRATHFLFLITFNLVLYSTFLTRSGVLGDTSVHAFTDLGMNFQLLAFLFVFLIPSFVFYAIRYKSIPHIVKEEQTSSREFWMFIGSLIFFLTALFITIATSLPVINKIFGSNFTMGEDAVFSYNRVIIFVAIIIGILTAVIQYLKYKQTDLKFFRKKIIAPTIISLIISTLALAFGNINYQEHGLGFLGAIWFAMVCSIYAIIANISYVWIGMKGKLKLSGGSISHLGFGLMLAGILISSSKKEVMSWNTSGIFVQLGEKNKITGEPGENLTLVKGLPTTMGNYNVTYESDSVHPEKPLWYYKIHFKNKTGNEQFTLMPNAFVNYKGNQGLMANPAARHYWDHDIFTYITSLPDPEKNKDTATFKPQSLKKGDTAFYSNGYYILEDLTSQTNIPAGGLAPDDKVFTATIKVFSKNNTSYISKPFLINKGGSLYPIQDTVTSENLIFQLTKADNNAAELGVRESNSIMQYITLKAYKFPFINLLWAGVLIMVTGITVSIVRRVQLNRSAREIENLTL
ncbi:MAG TPA: cytochrome c biogenesis protein CcsA [Chitinophagaceae bacterium]|nr:cytochrome c biogenesis protein CcsA [Chitinophagaceae bacterium]